MIPNEGAAAEVARLEARGARDLDRVMQASPGLTQQTERATAKANARVQAMTASRESVELIRADSITPEPIRWLWPGWLARGKLHVLAGAPGIGKTTLALDLAARISSGTAFPDGSRPRAGDVLIWSGEDDPKDTLIPRLLAAHADLAHVLIIGDVREFGERRPFDPASDIARLREAIAERTGKVTLIVVDPLVSAVTGDSHKNAEVRRGLAPLVDLCASLDAALLGITHFSKGTAGREPVERVTGSLAFGALARMVLGTGKRADGGLALARCKSNIGHDGGGFAYAFEQTPVPGHPGIEASRIAWGAPLEGSASELLAPPEADGERTASDEAVEFLECELADGPRTANAIQQAARKAGIADKALRTARERLGVKPEKTGFSTGWQWRLPAEDALESRRCPTQSEGALGAFVASSLSVPDGDPEAIEL